MRRADDVVLNRQIIEQEFNGKIVVRFDAANFGGRKNHNRWFFMSEKFLNGRLIREIDLRPIARREVVETLRLKAPDQSAADQAAMTRDENLIRLVHYDLASRGLAFSFSRLCAIVSW